MILVFASFVIGSLVYAVDGQVACTTPNLNVGKCISLFDCPPLLYLAHNTVEDVEYLLDSSRCGSIGDIPAVCCSSDRVSLPQTNCYTPDGLPGRCIHLYMCRHLADLLSSPVTQETSEYLKTLSCKGSSKQSVCCTTPPELDEYNPESCEITANPPDPESGCCGVDSRVGSKVDFTAPTLTQHPWLALIEYTRGQRVDTLCSGALISSRYVLTAAQCLRGRILKVGMPKNVRLGDYDISSDGPDCARVNSNRGDVCTGGELRIEIEKNTPHPDYNPEIPLKWNDIALIRLRETAPYTKYIRPICLPSLDLTNSLPPNFLLTEASWRILDDPKIRNVKTHIHPTFVKASECHKAYTFPDRKMRLSNGQLCASAPKGNRTRKIRGGVPLTYGTSRVEVIGITSFGLQLPGVEFPNVYTKVYEYNDWIRSNIEP